MAHNMVQVIDNRLVSCRKIYMCLAELVIALSHVHLDVHTKATLCGLHIFFYILLKIIVIA